MCRYDSKFLSCQVQDRGEIFLEYLTYYSVVFLNILQVHCILHKVVRGDWNDSLGGTLLFADRATQRSGLNQSGLTRTHDSDHCYLVHVQCNP